MGEPTARWKVRISGDPGDLVRLAQLLDEPSLAVAEADGEFYLESSLFEDLEDPAEVEEVAQERLKLLDGIVRIHEPQFRTPLGILGIRRGAGQFVILSTIEVRVRLGRPNPDDELRVWVALSADPDGAPARALRLYRTPTGANLYNILEIISEDLGGHEEIAKRGWATQDQLRSIRWTLQDYRSAGDDARHGKLIAQTNDEPVPIDDIRRLVRKVLEEWLNQQA